MNWFRIDKSKTVQPTSGNYRSWKLELREEGRRQCVYCAISESLFGGFRNFHVEHYKPKKKFAKLINNINNLFYCCGICNSFKGSDWPGEPTPTSSTVSYPDPSAIDYSEIFSISDDFRISSTTVAGSYVLERLYLNRPQLVLARRAAAVRKELVALSQQGRDFIAMAPEEIAGLLVEVIESLDRLTDVAPYEPDDVRRAGA